LRRGGLLAIFRLLSRFQVTQTVGKPGRLSRELRLGTLVLGLGAAGLLVVAARLEPSPLGYGTHRQLGLPPCTFVALWNVRCPSCGMTTAFAYVVRGQLGAAFRSNAGGMLLALATMLVAPWAVMSAIVGKFVIRPPGERVLVIAAIVVVTVTLVDWIGRLMAG
jgi:hypothetical protein